MQQNTSSFAVHWITLIHLLAEKTSCWNAYKESVLRGGDVIAHHHRMYGLAPPSFALLLLAQPFPEGSHPADGGRGSSTCVALRGIQL